MGKKGKKPIQTIEGGDLFKWLEIKKNRLMLFAAIEAVDDQEESFAHMSLLRGNGVDLGDNYALAARVMKIHRAGSDLSIPQLTLQSALEIEEKYGERITKYITKKARERGGYFRFMGMTKSMVELLRRGWVHIEDIDEDFKEFTDNFYLRGVRIDLVWPESYQSQQEAMEVLDKVGIPGRNGIITPKRLK